MYSYKTRIQGYKESIIPNLKRNVQRTTDPAAIQAYKLAIKILKENGF